MPLFYVAGVPTAAVQAVGPLVIVPFGLGHSSDLVASLVLVTSVPV